MHGCKLFQHVNITYWRVSVTILPLGGVKLRGLLKPSFRNNCLVPSLQKWFRSTNEVLWNFCTNLLALRWTVLKTPLTCFDVDIQVFAFFISVDLKVNFLSSGRTIENANCWVGNVMNLAT